MPDTNHFLQLRPVETPAKASAAFLPGSDTAVWLAEISRWNIPVERLRCFALPESRKTPQPGGLLVVAENAEWAAKMDTPDLYQSIGGRLFVPIRAKIWPAVQENEWKRLLHWPIQVFHPIIGLVGFALEDELDLAKLLRLSPADTKADWSLARPGLPDKPPFQSIQVLRPPGQDLLERYRSQLESRPLSELGDKSGERSELAKALDDAKINLLRGLMSAAGKSREALREILDNPNVAAGSSSSGHAWFERLDRWLGDYLRELENRRKNELDRLLDLFDRDSDEALKYALPLSDPYANRGVAPPSDRLGQRGTDFDLGKLGGGVARDNWEMDPRYYENLRRKYREAANKELEKGDFRRAAYIFAHLLGDYHAAANALERGKFWREAAALYKDHLKNMPAAAACLERGGLFLEAIEIYKTLGQWEKVGDLYVLAGQADKAVQAYEKCVATFLSTEDHLNAARVVREKLKQTERETGILLEGWEKGKQAEPCLKLWIERLVAQSEPQAAEQLREIFRQKTAPEKKPSFLRGLLHLQERQAAAPDLKNCARELAYEIISDAAVRKKDPVPLYHLKTFLPDDPLIAADAARFSQRGATTTVPSNQSFTNILKLEASTRWLSAAVFRNQIFAVGICQARVKIARFNWSSYVEYHTWEAPTKADQFEFLMNAYKSTQIILRANARIVAPMKNLEKTVHFFSPIEIGYPSFLPARILGMGLDRHESLINLVENEQSLDVQIFSLSGQLLRTVPCLNIPEEAWGQQISYPLADLVLHDKDIYGFYGDFVLKIQPLGHTQAINLGLAGHRLLIPPSRNIEQMVAWTNNGFIALHKVFARGEARDVDFFATDTPVSTASFIAENRLLLADKKQAALYRVDRDGAFLMQKFVLHTPARVVLSGPEPNSFCVLDVSGRVFIYRY